MMRMRNLGMWLAVALALVGITTARAAEPQLGPGDEISVQVARESELSGRFTISDAGKFVLPLVGEVQATGLTPSQLQAQLAMNLKRFIREPDVKIVLERQAQIEVAAYGKCRNVGLLNVKRGGTLLDALNAAQPLVMEKPMELTFTRGSKAEVMDLLKVVEGKDPRGAMPLERGDTLFVRELEPMTPKVYVLGKVAKPGAYEFKEGIKITDANTLAGGVVEPWDGSKGVIRRGNIEQALDLDALLKLGDLTKNMVLQEGDVIVVPEKIVPLDPELARLMGVDPITREKEDLISVTVLGAVERGGNLKVKREYTLPQVLVEAGNVNSNADTRSVVIARKAPDGKGQAIEVDLKKLVQGKSKVPVVIQDGDTIFVPARGTPREKWYQQLLRVLPFPFF